MTDISNFKFILDAYSAKEKVQLLKELYQDIAGYGINGDEELAHVNSFEVDILKSLGGSGTINKITELPQYFGGGRRPESKEVSEARLPSEIAPYVKDILEESQRLYGEAKDETYQEEPQTVAEVTEKEQLAREGLVGLMGTRDPYLEEGLKLYRGGTEKPTVEGMQEYMSPYQQLVTDIDKQKAQEAHEAGRAAFEARGVGAGGMSGMGTRMGLEAALREGRHGENLAAIQARGSQKAYEDAQKVFQMQKQRERQAAGDIIGTGEDIYGASLADYGLQAQVGEQERTDTQKQLDDSYRRWTQKQDFPETELAKYSGFVYGNPFMRGQADTTKTMTGPKGPSWGQQLFGAGVKLGGAYLGGPGMAAQGGRVSDYRAKHGGGLHDILETRYRKNNGSVADSSPLLNLEPKEYYQRLTDLNKQKKTQDEIMKKALAGYVRSPEQTQEVDAAKEQRRVALEKKMKESNWKKIGGMGLQTLGDMIMERGVAKIGPGGIPYYDYKAKDNLNRRIADYLAQSGKESKESKTRQRAALEREFATEEKIFEYPKKVQERLLALKKQLREKQKAGKDVEKLSAEIAKIIAETKKLEGPQQRTGTFKRLSAKQLNAEITGWIDNFRSELPQLTPAQNEKFSKAVRRLPNKLKKLVIRQQQEFMHADDKLAPRKALLKAIAKVSRENPGKLNLQRGESGVLPWLGRVWDDDLDPLND